MSVFEEIIVEGVRGPRRVRPPRRSDTPPGIGIETTREPFEPPPGRRPPVDIPPPTQGFVPPPVPPQLIPEIVVKGTATTRPPFGFGPVAKVNLATLFAVVGGTLIAKIFQETSQQKLDEALRETLAKGERRRPDTPVIVQPEIISEVIVTARRTDLLRPAIFPPPLITPDTDPFRLIPIEPRVFPSPAAPVVPLVEVPVPAPFVPSPTRSPLNVPQIRPTTIPSRRTRVSPSVRPSIRPGTSPQVAPISTPLPLPSPAVSPSVRPSVRPAVSPQVSTNPLTSINRRLAESTQRRFSIEPRTEMLAAQQQQCAPCPKCKKEEEEEKPRDKCFKQLVKQGLFPSLDTTYDWERIDCITGRPI